MTDYRLIDKKEKLSNRKEKFLNKTKVHLENETKQGLISKNQESDELVKRHRELVNKYRPDVVAKDPSTFAFFGSAKKYYEDSFYNIINFYPYDGTKKEVLKWFSDAKPLDVAMLQNHWPGSVGHLSLNESPYVSFYAGPQNLTLEPYMGNYLKGQTGLTLDATKGNTVEFWLNKKALVGTEEVIFDIGTVPGKVAASKAGQFKLYLSSSNATPSSGSPLYVSYVAGNDGVTNQNIGSSNIGTYIVDSNWHHYALRVSQEGASLNFDLYVDGEKDSTTKVSESSTLAKIDTYMGGRIGASQGASDGSLSGSIDEFRFWKGKRDARQISRNFDQKVFASEAEEDDYTSRLGLYYKFNKPIVGNTAKDQIVTDSSGNEITGIINNYGDSVRVPESAITLSDASKNTETKDPSLSDDDPRIKDKKKELDEIASAHDQSNSSIINNMVPDWVFDAGGQGLANPESEVSILMQLVASEFDSIKLSLDSILKERIPAFQEATSDVVDNQEITSSHKDTLTDYYIGCDDRGKVFVPTRGNHAWFSEVKLENMGISVDCLPLVNSNTDQSIDNVVEHVSITKPVDEIKKSILENIYASARFFMKRKGTERSFDPVLSSFGTDRNLISYNVYGRNSDTFLGDTELDFVTEERNSLSFAKNNDSTVFFSSSASIERTYLESDTKETEYTFEGTFIFPKFLSDEEQITTSTIFGLAEVSASNNDTAFTSQNNADFHVKVSKESGSSREAKFKLTSDSGIISSLESPIIKDVYDNSRWNIALRIIKDKAIKFVSSSAPEYKVELIGHNYILDNLQNSFNISSQITETQYQSFRQANKTIYLGAQRTNITGSVITKSDIKVVEFNGWNDDLTDQELKLRAQNPSITGRSFLNYRDNYDTENVPTSENKIFSIQFDGVSSLNASDKLVITDATSGSADQVIKYGNLVGHKYQASSTVFSSDKENVIQREYLPIVRNIPVGNIHGEQGIKIKDTEIDKFSLASRPESKLFSFEKSMYQVISREMVNFLGGLKTFNNLIGEPVNKYRKNYKMLENLRQRFYELVENESELERFINYYRWIDKSVGCFLGQLIPATADVNSGIEEVVESHALERNKFDHKAPLVERKEYDGPLEAAILTVNKLLYPWKDGHASPDEDENSVWQKERKEKDGDREKIRKVVTTTIEGSTFATRAFARPYKHSVNKETLLNIGSNKEKNKNPELYKIINEGKEITIDPNDIYDFPKFKDTSSPDGKRRYVAKTDTTTTDGYLDANADIILPFSLHSSSVGEDLPGFKSGLKITNNHDDVPALQGPFVKSFVGGMPHRHVKVGTEAGNRPEAYDISHAGGSLIIKQPTGPKSMFHRDLMGARFYNIGNRKTNSVIGNYSKEHEIVSINGRTSNNNYLVENEGSLLTGSLSSSPLIPESTDFYVPARPARDHVMVNRFNSPGGPETNGAYAMDREAGEFSVYNTVNYRNLLIRQTETGLSVEKSEKFGYRSGSASQASRHKTNRNTRRFTGSLGKQQTHDNNFVQHPIPRNDFGYSWITASAHEDVYSFMLKNQNSGYQHNFTISGSLESSQTIKFLTASDVGSTVRDFLSGDGDRVFGYANKRLATDAGAGNGFIPIDFVGMSTVIAEPVSSSTNTLGFPNLTILDDGGTMVGANYINQGFVDGGRNAGRETFRAREYAGGENLAGIHSILHGLIMHRQGPYGWPSWKQIRGDQHPITRNHRKNNKLSIVYREESGRKLAFVDSHKNDYNFDYKNTVDKSRTKTSDRKVENYEEMFVTSRFNPLNVNLTSFSVDALKLENLDIVVSRASETALSSLNQMSQHLMWFNDEHYLSSLSRGLDEERPGVSQSKDSFVFIDSADSAELNQEQIAAFYGVLNNTPSVSMKASVQNKISGFAQRKLSDFIIDGKVENQDLWANYVDDNKFRSDINLELLRDYLIQGRASGLMREMNYIETIYPREINTYLKRTRQRESFDFFGWNSSRSERQLQLNGNLTYGDPLVLAAGAVVNKSKMFFESSPLTEEADFTKSFFNKYEIVDLNSTGSAAEIASSTHITSSKWVLDSRENFAAKPINLSTSFFTDGNAFLSIRSQGTRGEGILQNDYSLFPMGYNGLRGAPPFAPVYNRRIPQSYSTAIYLAGEAKWEAANNRTGPFYDSYEDYADVIKTVGQNYSLIPEFRITNHFEKFTDTKNPESLSPDNFLELTGAVYNESSGDLSVGTQFFETYSMSDFMKYFHPIQKDLQESNMGLKPGKLTLRCQAVKRFLPYRGFYPAERVVQISEIFEKNYLKEGSYKTDYIPNNVISKEDAASYLKLRIDNSKSQAIKPLMAPGVLLNSIKTGLAVDYPIFTSSVANAVEHIFQNNITSSIQKFSHLNLGVSTCFTGSKINDSIDSGIPRIKGTIDNRVNFDDLLRPSRLFEKVLFDNEPHPSASLIYGQAEHLRVLDRPAVFGSVDKDASKRYSSIIFKNSRTRFAKSLYPFEDAVNNFCAETVNFFLEDGRLQTAISSPEPQRFENETYKMRVYVVNDGVTMYDRHSAFGPPVDDGNPQITTHILENTEIAGIAASGSIIFHGSDAVINKSGSTITVTDYLNSAKTYQFVTDILETKASASISIPVAQTLVPTNQTLGATITVKNFNNSPAAKTYQFVRNIAGAAATGSITVPTQTTLVPAAQTVGASFRIYDEDGTTFDDYQFVRNRSGATATGSINFDNAVSSSINGDTITIKNWNDSSTKTYEFVNNITAKPATGSITVPTLTTLVPVANTIGAGFTIYDESRTTFKTYKFVRDISGATATGSINFNGATNSGIDGDTITIKNWNDSSTKTYEFVNNHAGTVASGSLTFDSLEDRSLIDRGQFQIRNASNTAKVFEYRTQKTAQQGTIEFSLDYMPNLVATDVALHRYYGNGAAQNLSKARGVQPQAIIHVRANTGSDAGNEMRKFIFTADDHSVKPNAAYIDFTHLYSHNNQAQFNVQNYGNILFNYSGALAGQKFTIKDVDYHPGITHINRVVGATSSAGAIYNEDDLAAFKHLVVYPSTADPYRKPNPADRQTTKTYKFQTGDGSSSDYVTDQGNHELLINISGANAYRTPLRVAQALRDAINKRQTQYEGWTPRLTASIEAQRSFARFSFHHITSNPDSKSGWAGAGTPVPDTCGTHASELNNFKITIAKMPHFGEKHPEVLQTSYERASLDQIWARKFQFVTSSGARIDSDTDRRVVISSSIAGWFNGDQIAENFKTAISQEFNVQKAYLAPSRSGAVVRIEANHFCPLSEVATITFDDQDVVRGVNCIVISSASYADFNTHNHHADMVRLTSSIANMLLNQDSHDPTMLAMGGNNKWHGFGGGFVRLKIESLVGGTGADVSTPAQAASSWAAWSNSNAASSHGELFRSGQGTSGNGSKRWLDFTGGTDGSENGFLHANPKSVTLSFTSSLTGDGSNADRFENSLGGYRVVDTYDYLLSRTETEILSEYGSGRAMTEIYKDSISNAIFALPDPGGEKLLSLAVLEQTASIRLISAINYSAQLINSPENRFTAQKVTHHMPNIPMSIGADHNRTGSFGGFAASDFKGIKITTDYTGSHRNGLFEYIPISFSAGKAVQSYVYSGDELYPPFEQNIIRMSGNYDGPGGPTRAFIPNASIPDVRTIKKDFYNTGGLNLTGVNELSSSTTITGGQFAENPTNASSDAASAAHDLSGGGTVCVVGIPLGASKADVASLTRTAIISANGLSGISAVRSGNTLNLTYTTVGNHDKLINGNSAYINAPAGGTGMKGGTPAISETNGQAMSNGNIAVVVNDCDTINEIQTRFTASVATAQANDFTFSIGGASTYPVTLTMPYANSASAGDRKITGTGHFSSRVGGFSRGLNPLTFANGSRVDAATGWTGGSNASIAIPVGTSTTYAQNGASTSTGVVAGRIESAVESNNSTIQATVASNTVNFTQTVASKRGNHSINFSNIGGSSFGSSSISHFQGGRDAISETNGQAMSNGNIAVTVDGANSVSAIQTKFKSAVETAQAGDFTLSIGGSSPYPVNLTMPYANSASAGDRKITGTGHFSSRVGGFSRGINPITFTNGQRVDAGTGWTGGTNTKKVILVGTSTTYAQASPGNQTTTAIAGFIESVVESNNSTIEATTDSNTVNFTQTVASKRGNHSIGFSNSNGSSFASSSISHFQGGTDALIFAASNARVDAATGWSQYYGGTTNSNIVVRCGTGPTSDNQGTIRNRLKTSIDANNTSFTTNVGTNQVQITQSAAGTNGNQVITFANNNGSNLLASSIDGFRGGVDAQDFTTGQAMAGGSIAVVIGTKNVGNVSGSDSYLSRVNARNELITAIDAAQGSTIATAAGSDGSSQIVNLTQKGTGSAGNLAIASQNFKYSDDDIAPFEGGTDFVAGTLEYTPTTAVHRGSHGFLPYVAPFLDPNTSPYAELSFSPSTAGEYTIPQILDDLNITYHNMDAPSNAGTNTNYKEAMVLSASINFKNFVKLKSDHLLGQFSSRAEEKRAIDSTTSNLFRWVIQPKWETPILDFSNVTASALRLSDNTVVQVSGSPWKVRYQDNYYDISKSSSAPYLTASTGMWHQSGNLIEQQEDKGYYMVIESGDLGQSDKYAAKDLASKVGFLGPQETRRDYKLGRIAETKEVYEAVVAIPFYNDPEDGVKFFNLDQDSYERAVSLNKEAKNNFARNVTIDELSPTEKRLLKQQYKSSFNAPGSNATENIAYQLRMMEKFVLPPQFDFMSETFNCDAVPPFVQYIFQFHTEFTKHDLASMWQNLYPNSAKSAATTQHSNPFSKLPLGAPHDVEYISNYLDTSGVEMFKTRRSNYESVDDFFQNEVRWLVFKAKQRAIGEYQKVVLDSMTDGVPRDIHTINNSSIKSMFSDLQIKKIRGESVPSSNWPYDFFSLVELGKLETKVDFHDTNLLSRSPQKESGFETTMSAYTSAQRQGQEGDGGSTSPMSYEIIKTQTLQSTAAAESSVDIASSMVFREVLLADTQTPSTRVFTVSNATVSSGTEQVFVNGILQSVGSGNDYTISGNTVTFTYDLEQGDNVVISYVKD